MSKLASTSPSTVAAGAARVTAAFAGPAFFGLSGSGNFHLTHDLRDAGLEYFAATHEMGAVAMADAYARTTGTIGVVTFSQGPGLTHAVTALRESVRSHTPLVALAAALPRHEADHNQYADQVAIAAAVGAGVEVLTRTETVLDDVARAFRRAATEERPVVLMLPTDLQGEQFDESIAFDPRLLELPRAPDPDRKAIEAAARLIADAWRPVILAGRGAATAGAGAEIAAVADATGATLLTSTQAHSLFREHPRALGLAGGFGSPTARAALAEADVVVVFGCSLNPWTLAGNADLAAHAAIVRVDSHPRAFATAGPTDLPILADCRAAATALLGHLEGSRSADAAPAAPSDTVSARAPRGGTRTIDPADLTRRLDEMLPAERTVAIDSGNFMVFPASMLGAPDPPGFLLAQGYMSMGLGIAGAIGAAVARPERLPVVAVGDGGAKMSIGELETAVRYDLPLLIVVYNDAAFGAEVHDFGESGRPLDTVRFGDVDFATVARGFGAAGVTVRSVADLDAINEWLSDRPGPLLVDAKVDPTIAGPWVD